MSPDARRREDKTMSNERRPAPRTMGLATRRRAHIPVLCLLLAMPGLLRAAAPAGAASNLSVSPGIIDFGLVTIGQQVPSGSTRRTSGQAPTGTIQVAGSPTPADFTPHPISVAPIQPGASPTWTIPFHPTKVETLDYDAQFQAPHGNGA